MWSQVFGPYYIIYEHFVNFQTDSFLLVPNYVVLKPLEERQRTEKDAIRIATEIHAEFWAVSAKTGKVKSSHLLVLYNTVRLQKYSDSGQCRKLLEETTLIFRRECAGVFLQGGSFGVREVHPEGHGECGPCWHRT